MGDSPGGGDLGDTPTAPEHSTISDALEAVLDELDRPESSEAIAALLTASGTVATPADVTSLLQGTYRAFVERLDDGRWRAKPVTSDPDQTRVIACPPSERLMVVAGPGAGKTEVACGRVIETLRSGAHGRSILMISFTRAATAEVRSRLERVGATWGVSTRGVEIRTLDSLAWALQRNLQEADLLGGSYADNIERMIQLLDAAPPALTEHLASLRLVVIDEAQDIVGRRSDLAIRLVQSLPPSTGVTVFADPAQAIYGDWALEETEIRPDAKPFSVRLEDGEAGQFTREELRGSHRTDDPALRRIADGLREFLLVRDISGQEAYDHVQAEVERHAGKRGAIGDLVGLARSDVTQFFLFRTHGEVVQLSSFLSSSGIIHRLRFPGLPVPVEPWIGRLLFLGSDRRLRRASFDRLWTERVASSLFATVGPDDAWDRLMGIAGESDGGYVDVVHLREILSRRNPPDEIVRASVGVAGPVIGTIHGSKGREADNVVLAMSALRDDADRMEEARVLYVGATRARKELQATRSSSGYAYLKSRRAWRRTYSSKTCLQLEFGLDGDLDPVSPVSYALGGDGLALDRQERIAGLAPGAAEVRWETVRPASPTGEWRRVLMSGDGRDLAVCGPGFERDLWQVAERLPGSFRPADSQLHLWVIDHTTVARDDDSADMNKLTKTFATSGFWVAPIIKGFSLVCPQRRRG